MSLLITSSSNTTLPEPLLARKRLGSSLHVLTDDGLFDATGIRIAFTERDGGISKGAYASLNLGIGAGEGVENPKRNLHLLERAFDLKSDSTILFNQVHGVNIIEIDSDAASSIDAARQAALEGADGAIVAVRDVSIMLCFADCVPVAIASPSGAFSIVHAGWRGVVGKIAPKAIAMLARNDVKSGCFETVEDACASYNVYIGPYIHAECFEVGSDVHTIFVEEFGDLCAPDANHIDLGAALKASIIAAGCEGERIADVDICTRCNTDRFFSYRAHDGICGRHAAIGFRR